MPPLLQDVDRTTQELGIQFSKGIKKRYKAVQQRCVAFRYCLALIITTLLWYMASRLPNRSFALSEPAHGSELPSIYISVGVILLFANVVMGRETLAHLSVMVRCLWPEHPPVEGRTRVRWSYVSFSRVAF